MLRIVAFAVGFGASLGAVVQDEITACAKFGVPGLPCLEVPRCPSRAGVVDIRLLSSGAIPSQETTAHSTVLCHDDASLTIEVELNQQRSSSSMNNPYTTCNSAIYNLDVFEMFIAPGLEAPHCYSEIDISLTGVPFFSGIFNPNLNHTGISNFLIDCTASGIDYRVSNSRVQENQSWRASLKIPLALINSPTGCPLQPSPPTSPPSLYRANFFRINSKVETGKQDHKCSVDTCDYLAFSPNGVDPPSFHEPKAFATLVFV